MENPITHEPVMSPDDLEKFFILRANTGDVEGLVALYEPNAVICGNGQIVIGIEAIHRFFTELLATQPHFAPGEQSPSMQNDDLALTSSRFENGSVTAEVARRQLDGRWLWAIDQFIINPKLQD